MKKKKQLTLKELEKAIGDIFYNKDGTRRDEKYKDFFITYYTWIAEDGTPCSSWRIGNIMTGDGGMKLFHKALEEKYQEKSKINLENPKT